MSSVESNHSGEKKRKNDEEGHEASNQEQKDSELMDVEDKAYERERTQAEEESRLTNANTHASEGRNGG